MKVMLVFGLALLVFFSLLLPALCWSVEKRVSGDV